jgi:hypothetical protein
MKERKGRSNERQRWKSTGRKEKERRKGVSLGGINTQKEKRSQNYRSES